MQKPNSKGSAFSLFKYPLSNSYRKAAILKPFNCGVAVGRINVPPHTVTALTCVTSAFKPFLQQHYHFRSFKRGGIVPLYVPAIAVFIIIIGDIFAELWHFTGKIKAFPAKRTGASLGYGQFS